MRGVQDSFDREMQRIERLIAELESQPASEQIEQARALVQAVLEVHAIGLGAIWEGLRREAGADLGRELTRDPRIAALLSLHGLLHGLGQPLDAREVPEPRARDAAEGTRLVPVERLLRMAGERRR